MPTNLEPIEDRDLNLKEKFSGEKKSAPIENPSSEAGAAGQLFQAEKISQPEGNFERKEGQVEKEEAYAKILAHAANPTLSTDQDISQDADLAMKEKDAESKVNNLVNLAETKGLAHAVKVAKHMEDNYVLDEFHDKLLSEELHDFLVKKNLIKQN